MIGRGVFQNLMVFRPDGAEFRNLSTERKLELLRFHLDLFEATWKDTRPYAVMKKFFKVYISSIRNAAELRMRLVETNSFEEARIALDDYQAGLKEYSSPAPTEAANS